MGTTVGLVACIVLRCVAHMDVGSPMSFRGVHRLSVRVSKGVAHHENRNQQNRYKSVHRQILSA